MELKRDEARCKANYGRRKRRQGESSLTRRKQQQALEEQGLGKPKSKPKKPRPKSVHREESYSDSGTKCSSTRKCPAPAPAPAVCHACCSVLSALSHWERVQGRGHPLNRLKGLRPNVMFQDGKGQPGFGQRINCWGL